MMRYFLQRMPVMLLGLVLLPALAADSSNPALDVLVQVHQEGARGQARIDKLDDAMRRMRDEMRQSVLQQESLKADLPELQRYAAAQASRRAQLESEFSAGVPGQLDVLPSLQQMVAWLERFIQADIPFNREHRLQRVAGLRSLLANDTVPPGDKLRAVLEVTQVELQYGRSVETYSGSLAFGGKEEPLEFLRVGRLMLYYQDIDGTKQGYWDRKVQRWQPLPESERTRIHAAIQMAKGESPIQLLELSIPTPAPMAGAGS